MLINIFKGIFMKHFQRTKIAEMVAKTVQKLPRFQDKLGIVIVTSTFC